MLKRPGSAVALVVFVRTKGGRRQTCLVREVRRRGVVPRIADRLRIDDVRAGDENRRPVDPGDGFHVLAIWPGDLESGDGAAAACLQRCAGVIEPNPDRTLLARGLAVERARATVLRQ